MQNHIIGSAIIEHDGKYLMVQEAENHVDDCKGKWGAPGGHVDPKETITEATLREVREEAGYDVKLKNICQIGTDPDPTDTYIVIVFSAEIIGEAKNLNVHEISAQRWFTYEEICAMKAELRCPELMIGAIENLQSNITAPLDIIKVYPPIHKES